MQTSTLILAAFFGFALLPGLGHAARAADAPVARIAVADRPLCQGPSCLPRGKRRAARLGCADGYSCYPLYGAYGPYGGVGYWGGYTASGWANR
jgi:hypothetical protein